MSEQPPSASAAPSQTTDFPLVPDTLTMSEEPPLTEYYLSVAVPSFLKQEQQDLYRRALYVYEYLFGSDTSGVEEFLPDHMQASQREPYETVELDGFYYQLSQGRYRHWSNFDAMVHSIFTDDFVNNHNRIWYDSVIPVYRDIDGRLGFIDAARGCGYYYNKNFPDEFILESQTDTEINFTLIGHYSPIWPRDNETSEERTRRRKESFEYTAEFPIKLILTENGWRFDSFYSALADEVAND